MTGTYVVKPKHKTSGSYTMVEYICIYIYIYSFLGRGSKDEPCETYHIATE
jgi:hypothetical protein